MSAILLQGFFPTMVTAESKMVKFKNKLTSEMIRGKITCMKAKASLSLDKLKGVFASFCFEIQKME